MVSICEKTVMHRDPYISRFEDEYSNVQEKEFLRPTVAHMLYEYLPLICKHNTAQQNAIALKKCWLTKKLLDSDPYNILGNVCCRFAEVGFQDVLWSCVRNLF